MRALLKGDITLRVHVPNIQVLGGNSNWGKYIIIRYLDPLGYKSGDPLRLLLL